MNFIIKRVLVPLFLVSVMSCGFDTENNNENNPDDGISRSFKMGFTGQLYDEDMDAVNDNFEKINQRADVVTYQFRDGIPWQEAFDNAALPTQLETEITDMVAQTNTKTIVLSIDVINSSADGMIGTWSADGEIDSQAPWSERSFDDEEVITAYTNYAIKLIERFNAEYLIYGEQVSELALNNNETLFTEFTTFAERVYDNIKLQKPNVKLLYSVLLRSPNDSETTIVNAKVSELKEHVDVIGLSVYPYRYFSHSNRKDPQTLPTDWLSQAQTIADGKPIAITQTGWVAENLTLEEESFIVSGTAAFQSDYIDVLLQEANRLDLEFVTWYTAVDYDTYWTENLGSAPGELLRRDTGLYNQDLVEREGLTIWNDFYERTIQ